MIHIVFATETGTAEDLAHRTQSYLRRAGFAASLTNLAKLKPEALREMETCLGIASTWGAGDPPYDAEPFFKALKKSAPMSLGQLRFSVLALGDESYPDFCQCGKDLDAELERHGAARLFRRIDCDVDYEDPFEEWVRGVMGALVKQPAALA